MLSVLHSHRCLSAAAAFPGRPQDCNRIAGLCRAGGENSRSRSSAGGNFHSLRFSRPSARLTVKNAKPVENRQIFNGCSASTAPQSCFFILHSHRRLSAAAALPGRPQDCNRIAGLCRAGGENSRSSFPAGGNFHFLRFSRPSAQLTVKNAIPVKSRRLLTAGCLWQPPTPASSPPPPCPSPSRRSHAPFSARPSPRRSAPFRSAPGAAPDRRPARRQRPPAA